jgi:hypothetical protein
VSYVEYCITVVASLWAISMCIYITVKYRTLRIIGPPTPSVSLFIRGSTVEHTSAVFEWPKTAEILDGAGSDRRPTL